MNEQERKHFEQVTQAIAPFLGQVIKKAMLEALRQHSKEQIAAVVQGGLSNGDTKKACDEVYFGPLANRPTTTEVPGEREVWAQAYRAGIIAHKSPENCRLCADLAVKAFRECYK